MSKFTFPTVGSDVDSLVPTISVLKKTLTGWSDQVEARLGQLETNLNGTQIALSKLAGSATPGSGSSGGGSGGGGGGGTTLPPALYRPTTFTDNGANPTVDPALAYDTDRTTAALVSAIYTANNDNLDGDCTWSGFTSFVTSVVQTLYILVQASTSSSSGLVTVFLNGMVVYQTSSTQAQQVATFSIPVGTNINTLSARVRCLVHPFGSTQFAGCYVYDIGIY